MTFCEMHKPSGCGECPNRYICGKKEFKIGETLDNEKIIRISKPENMLVTQIYNKVTCRWETNFYYLNTLEHYYTKSR